MYEIKNSNKELNSVEEYALTSSRDAKMIKEIPDNTKLEVEVYANFTKTNEETGEVTELLSILTTDNEVYTTQSETFKRSFSDCVMAARSFPVIPIIKISGVTKSGRDFVDCTLDIEKAKELM